jgi:Flp pilus assembly protein TadD
MFWRRGRGLSLAFGAGLVVVLAVLAMLRAQVFESEEALWRDTIARNPAAWLAHANLGWILAKQQNYDEAKTHLVASLELNPNNAQAHCNLGRLLSLQGKPAEAEEQFQAALKIKPKDAEIRRSYASALAEQGRQAEAVAQFREALRLHSDTETRLQLAVLFVQSCKPREAVAEYCQVLMFKPDQPEALNNVAWLLATSADATVRNGAEAVRLAEHACRLSGNAQPPELGALAAAYAEAGRFPEAVETAQKAVDAARAGGNDQLAALGEQLLHLFRAGKPYHEPGASPTSPSPK